MTTAARAIGNTLRRLSRNLSAARVCARTRVRAGVQEQHDHDRRQPARRLTRLALASKAAHETIASAKRLWRSRTGGAKKSFCPPATQTRLANPIIVAKSCRHRRAHNWRLRGATFIARRRAPFARRRRHAIWPRECKSLLRSLMTPMTSPRTLAGANSSL